jgi:molybdenum cofactor cytidylyltransferase
LISLIVLAAGEARRFGGGGAKLVAEVQGVPLVRVTVGRALASRIGEVIVVVGAGANAVRDVLAGLDVRIVTNPDYASGMSSSIRTGLDAISSSATAAIILLGDQPGGTSTLQALVRARVERGTSIVVPSYRGTLGNPVLFDRSVFDEIRAVRGDRGGREVIERDPTRVTTLDVDADAPTDVDTRADIATIERELPSQRPR